MKLIANCLSPGIHPKSNLLEFLKSLKFLAIKSKLKSITTRNFTSTLSNVFGSFLPPNSTKSQQKDLKFSLKIEPYKFLAHQEESER